MNRKCKSFFVLVKSVLKVTLKRIQNIAAWGIFTVTKATLCDSHARPAWARTIRFSAQPYHGH